MNYKNGLKLFEELRESENAGKNLAEYILENTDTLNTNFEFKQQFFDIIIETDKDHPGL